MRKYLLTILFNLAILCIAAQGVEYQPAEPLPYPTDIQQRLDTLLTDKILQTSQLGLMVYDLTADSAIYCHNERQTMRPASTQKLVTAITALDRLGGDYQLCTSLYYTGTVRDNTLKGSLICVGGMDPAFDADDMKAFAESVRQMGIYAIQGNIVADRSMKDDDLLGEGWCWDDDNPTLSPLLCGRKDNFAERLVLALRNSGVTVDAQITVGRLPAQATMICTTVRTIDDILRLMMKDSDNLYAEAVFYQLAAATGGRPATAKHARQSIERLVQQVGLNPSDYKVADGSGLSLYNYVTPEMHVRLLRYAYHNPAIIGHLLQALPIAGIDGTLKSRMKGTPAEGNVRAKTGTVTCVSALAGYCTTAGGHDLCFAIMNQGVLRVADGRNFQDRVCRILCSPASTPLSQAIAPVQPPVPAKAKGKTPRKPQKMQKQAKRHKRRRR